MGDDSWEGINEIERAMYAFLMAFKAVTFLNGVPVSPQKKHASWSKDGILYAECRKKHKPPNENCGCGIYATISRKILVAYIRGTDNLLCPTLLVTACGDTEVWSSGWRAEAAQAHYIVNDVGDMSTGVPRANQAIALAEAEMYFGLPVVSLEVAIDLIIATWRDCGYRTSARSYDDSLAFVKPAVGREKWA